MHYSLFTLFMLAFLISLTPTRVMAGSATVDYGQMLEKKQSNFEKKIKDLSSKQKAKLDKKVSKIKKKLDRRGSAEEARDGVRTGLIILGIGAIIALLGLTGVGDILITIGLVVLILGLIFWLLD
jgi:Flp pilus assembly protein TadB